MGVVDVISQDLFHYLPEHLVLHQLRGRGLKLRGRGLKLRRRSLHGDKSLRTLPGVILCHKVCVV